MGQHVNASSAREKRRRRAEGGGESTRTKRGKPTARKRAKATAGKRARAETQKEQTQQQGRALAEEQKEHIQQQGRLEDESVFSVKDSGKRNELNIVFVVQEYKTTGCRFRAWTSQDGG